MKIFIESHIRENNAIITDGWTSCNFLGNSNYIHEIQVHGPIGNFGIGNHPTSHIEGILGTLKIIINKMYNYIQCDNDALLLGNRIPL